MTIWQPPSKVCSDCGERKALGAFNRERRGADGRQRFCRVCQSRRNAQQYQRRQARAAGTATPRREPLHRRSASADTIAVTSSPAPAPAAAIRVDLTRPPSPAAERRTIAALIEQASGLSPGHAAIHAEQAQRFGERLRALQARARPGSPAAGAVAALAPRFRQYEQAVTMRQPDPRWLDTVRADLDAALFRVEMMADGQSLNEGGSLRVPREGQAATLPQQPVPALPAPIAPGALQPAPTLIPTDAEASGNPWLDVMRAFTGLSEMSDAIEADAERRAKDAERKRQQRARERRERERAERPGFWQRLGRRLFGDEGDEDEEAVPVRRRGLLVLEVEPVPDAVRDGNDGADGDAAQPRTCRACGQRFTTADGRIRYCSPDCRLWAQASGGPRYRD